MRNFLREEECFKFGPPKNYNYEFKIILNTSH